MFFHRGRWDSGVLLTTWGEFGRVYVVRRVAGVTPFHRIGHVRPVVRSSGLDPLTPVTRPDVPLDVSPDARPRISSSDLLDGNRNSLMTNSRSVVILLDNLGPEFF